MANLKFYSLIFLLKKLDKNISPTDTRLVGFLALGEGE